MKKNYFFKLFVLLVVGLGISTANAQETYNFTGALQTYTVPAGVTKVQIECFGAQGSNGGGVAAGVGGLGGYSKGILNVTPGQVLNILVGGSSGFNGGGTGGNIGAGNGGGATDVRVGGLALADRVIVAGGGGGGGSTGCVLSHAGGNGGGGGGLAGVKGVDSPNGGGGFGGTLGVGGAAGIGCGGFLGSPGLGTGNGGNGQGCCCATTPGGGGGGGGFVNGGGGGGGSAGTVGCSGNDKGGGGGGAGGSSSTGTLLDPVMTNNVRIGQGQAIISIVCEPLVVTSTDYEICLGEGFTALASGTGVLTWDGGLTDGVEFIPATAGVHLFTVSAVAGIDECITSQTLEILVNELPNVTASASDEEVCEGDEIIFTGGGAETYVWDPAEIIDGSGLIFESAGTFTASVTGTDVNGCVNTASVEFTVYPALVISTTTTDEMAGSDGEIDATISGGNPPYAIDWDNDGTGDFDDAQDLTGLVAGTYVIVVEDAAGCTAEDVIVVGSQVGISENNATGVKLYPNPTSTDIVLELAGQFSYEVVAVNGDILLVGSAVDKTTVSLVNLATGVYFVKVKNANAQSEIKVVKK